MCHQELESSSEPGETAFKLYCREGGCGRDSQGDMWRGQHEASEEMETGKENTSKVYLNERVVGLGCKLFFLIMFFISVVLGIEVRASCFPISAFVCFSGSVS